MCPRTVTGTDTSEILGLIALCFGVLHLNKWKLRTRGQGKMGQLGHSQTILPSPDMIVRYVLENYHK